MNKWGYNFLIEWKTLWEKEKLLIMSNFSFSHNVLKSCLLLMRQNEYLWSKGLTLSLMMMTQEALVDSVDQNQTIQNVQSDL